MVKIVISAPSRQDNYSVHQLYQNIAAVLSTQHEVITMPDFASDASIEGSLQRQVWIEQHQQHCEILITSSPTVIQSFRESAWRGTVVLNHLGDLPRGAVGLRAAQPYLKTTDILWCSSSADRSILELLLDRSRLPVIKQIAYGVKDSVFVPQQNKQASRSLLGWEQDEFILVYAGRITAEKNIHALYEALYYLNRLSNLTFRLVLVGQITDAPFYEFNLRFSDLDRKLQDLKRKYELEHLITHIPWMPQEELNTVFNAADLFVNLTLHHDENYGFSQVEAMSAGLPVVCTAWGGLKDTVADAESGFTCPTWLTSAGVRYHLPQFIHSVYRLATNRSLLEAQAQAARARVVDRFSQACFARNMLQLIEEISRRSEEQLASHQPGFSNFGQRYNERFSTFYDSCQRRLAGIPVYSGFADGDYQQLIAAYASGNERGNDRGSDRDNDSRNESNKSYKQLFLGLNGVVRGQYYYSHDLLWPIRTAITPEEREILSMLNRSSYTAISYEQQKLIDQLLQKGLVGCAHQ